MYSRSLYMASHTLALDTAADTDSCTQPIKLADAALQANVFNLRQKKVIRDLNPEDIEQLVSVSGMVTRCSNIIPEIRRASNTAADPHTTSQQSAIQLEIFFDAEHAHDPVFAYNQAGSTAGRHLGQLQGRQQRWLLCIGAQLA